jgi:hypoxanthine phosphoribosyltransferase
MFHDLYDDIETVLIDQARLHERIQELAQQIEDDYDDVDDLLLVCVLKGAYSFLSDLSLMIKRPHQIEFMAVSSYGAGTRSSGAVRLLLDLRQDISGRHVLVIEDIIDSGKTLDYLARLLKARNPASLRVCTLLSKPSRREIDVPVDYIGFDIPDEFVVGYGLDYAELYRNIPYVGILKPEIFSPSD